MRKNTGNIQAALNVGMEYLRQNPLEQVEILLRKGIYEMTNNHTRPSLSIKHFCPLKNGRLIIAGAGKTVHNGPERSLGLFKYIIGVTYIAGKLGHIPVQNS